MLRRRSLLLLSLLLLALPALGLRCKPRLNPTPITLTYWRVFDDPDTLTDSIAAYREIHPHVTVAVKKIRYEEYERLFLEALAEDRGPDLFSIPSTWIGEYQSKIAPMPKTATLPFRTMQGTIRREVVSELKTVPLLTPAAVRKAFLDVVGGDVIRPATTPEEKTEEQILGLPLSVDTLALFYNRDLLNAAGIATEPRDWTEFLRDVIKLTRFDEEGNIVLSGAALGTARNVPRFADILAALMMQNGAAMADANGFPTFHLVPPGSTTSSYRPGLEALRFYTDFASPTKEAYTWNVRMPDALEAFTQGKTAFFLGYTYHISAIKARAPQLRWAIAPLPQADSERNRVNVANYWVETVAKKTPHVEEAWAFLQFITAEPQAQKYLQRAGKPTALRALVEAQLTDPTLEPFAGQLLTARSWYRGRDAGLMEEALADLVEGALADPAKLGDLVNTAVARINQTIY